MAPFSLSLDILIPLCSWSLAIENKTHVFPKRGASEKKNEHLLRSTLCYLLPSSQEPCELDEIIPVSHVRKLRLVKFKSLA